ncbi:MAG: DUF3365 domain-containing protein [Fuerstiella sp.]
MKCTRLAAALLMPITISLLIVRADEPTTEQQASVIPPPASVAEARARARLLHETIHGSLQVMHRDFFDEEESRMIPSQSLEDVFSELKQTYHVDVKWLIVDTDVVNVDHQPADDFEKKAAEELGKGRPHFESTDDTRYRYAGPVRLASQCLKCHVRGRTSTKDRTAGLVISMPLNNDSRNRTKNP